MDIFQRYPKSSFLGKLPNDSEIFPLRKRIAELFPHFAGLEDPHFGQELDRDPHSRLWEMVVAKILRSEGYEPTSAAHGPDFVVKTGNQRVFIEAVCPDPGKSDNPNSLPPMADGECGAKPTEKIVLRIRAALEEKKRQYMKYCDCGIVSADDICVVAVSSSKLGPRAIMCPPAVARATLGQGNPYVVFDWKEGVFAEGVDSCESIVKANGSEVSTTFFLSDENSLIAAVLYSVCSVFSLTFDPFGESMIAHNPKARMPLPRKFFKQIKEL